VTPFHLSTVWAECPRPTDLPTLAESAGRPVAFYRTGETVYARLMRGGETAAEALADALTAYRDDPIAAEVRRTFGTVG
jgi:hypothetical protein